MIDTLYTKKQMEALKLFKKNFFMLTLHGAKRSGKTVVDNDLFLLELKRVKQKANELKIKEPLYILTGNSLGTIERNILNELRNKYGIKFHINKFNEFKLLGVKVCMFGHGKTIDMDRIRGMTAFGAYINEGTTASEVAFKEILSRCSVDGARIIMDTNPEDPEHYIKKDYIDKADGERLIEINFSLYDNTFLSQEYIKNMELVTPSGVFFDRNIKGMWTTADGAVYQDFNKSKHLIMDISQYDFIDYVVGIDWGYEHYGAICLFGITSNNEFVLLKTIRKQYQEIDYWIDELKKIKEEYGNIQMYADSARPEYIMRCRKEKLKVFNGDKAVLSDISENKTFVNCSIICLPLIFIFSIFTSYTEIILNSFFSL